MFLFKGDTSKGGKVAITQSKLKPDITNTLGDSDIGTHSSLSLEDLSRFAVSSLNAVDHHAYNVNKKVLTDMHLTKESLNIANLSELADQKVLSAPSTSYPHREKFSIFPGGHAIGQSLTVSAVTHQPEDWGNSSTLFFILT